MANSQDPDELKHIWLEWRNAVGPRVKGMYERYVNLSNEAARLNNFADMGKVWLENFESDDIREQLEKLWQQVKPLYLQIHAYVRYKLREKYGDIVSERGPLPAHLLGNIWGQAWNKVGEFSLPYPHAADIIITDEMVKQVMKL